MLRAILLSLLMLCAVAVTLPIVESHAGRSGGASWRSRSRRMRNRHRIAYLRRRRAARARARMLAVRRQQQEAARANGSEVKLIPASASMLTNGLTTPAGWSVASAGSETRWKTSAGAGVAFAPLGRAGSDEAVSNSRYRTLGGYTHSDLRRQVIDRMVTEGGWVTNDAARRIGSHQTFVVEAANGDQASPRRWTFYFTVVGDKLYRFVSDAPDAQADKVAGEVESLVAALRPDASSAPLTARTSAP